MYLCLMVGSSEIPKGLDGEEMSVGEKEKRREILNERRRRKVVAGGGGGGGGKKGKKKEENVKDWVLKKKDLYRTRGKEGWVFIVMQ